MEEKTVSAVTRAGLPLKKDVLIRAGFPLKGGAGSGNFGHEGRPGEGVGGSGGGGGGTEGVDKLDTYTESSGQTYTDYSQAVYAFEQYAGTLTEDQRETFVSYSLDGYKNINGVLRDDGAFLEKNLPEFMRTDEIKENITNRADEMNRIIAGAPKYEGTVYRGIKSDSVGRFEEFKSMEAGQPFQFNGVVSTSQNETFAKDWASEGKYQIELRVLGAQGVAIEGVSEIDAANEREILLPHQSTGAVISKEILDPVSGGSGRVRLTIQM
jgi:hypothetical protein